VVVLLIGHLQREANEIQVFQPLPSDQWFFRWPIYLMLLGCKRTFIFCMKTKSCVSFVLSKMTEEACMMEQLPPFLLHRFDDKIPYKIRMLGQLFVCGFIG